MSKPLIETPSQEQELTYRKFSQEHSWSNAQQTETNATYTNKLTSLSPLASHGTKNINSDYAPPSYDQNDEEANNLIYQQLTSATMQPLGTKIEKELLRERHVESQNISNQMQQILEINQDLAALVSDQQETIDIIEENAYEVHDHAERGLSQLRKAQNIMRNTIQREGFMRIFFMVIGAGGLLIALVMLLESL
jgi:hypothetical protein